MQELVGIVRVEKEMQEGVANDIGGNIFVAA